MNVQTELPKLEKARKIKCPKCKKGRICDIYTNTTSQVFVSNVAKDISIKCPKCGVLVNLEVK